MKIAKETWIILAIGMADLATTILFIQHNGAEEANPIFRQYWEMGLAAFVGAKIVLLVGPLSILEWARHHRPRFVAWALRSAIVAYVVMYGVGYFRLNHAPTEEISFADMELPSVHLQRRTAGHGRPMMHTIKQTSSVVWREPDEETVTVY